MLHRDFLIRQIQQAVQVLMQALASVLKLKSEERFEEAIQQISRAFGEIDLAPRPVGELNAKELVDLCSTSQGFQVDLALSIADLLREEGEILRLQGRGELACASEEKALALYRRAIRTEGAAMPMDIHTKMSSLEARLDEHCA